MAQKLGARLAAALFDAVVAVMVLVSAVPTIATWRFAQRERVSLSLSEYLHNSHLEGEPPVPVISPAVVNVLSRLTGKRYRTLPQVTV